MIQPNEVFIVIKRARFLLLMAVAVTAALAQTPTITAVENAASYVPPGLPNSGIAQGSLFVVKGTNLGPATLAIATVFPLPPSIGGTSVTVTVGSTTVNAVMYYSLAAQIAAILPSKTPTGTGTVKVTYNGQSVTAPIVVVQSSVGIFTVSQSGAGDAIAFLNSDSGLITPSHAANPGEVLVFWGTGLGPVTSDETQPAVQSDLTNIPLQVIIGGKPATILFRGRNACCSSVDTVYVTVPDGLSGCAVSVNMQIGNLVSNTTTIAVATTGRTCTPVSSTSTGVGTGTHSYGGIVLERIDETFTVLGTTTSTKMDMVAGIFEKITYSGTPPQGSQLDVNSYGSCTVSTQTAGQGNPSSSTGSIQYLDAGASLAMTAPFGNRTLAKSSPAAGYILYSANLDQTATTFTPGQYVITGTGGADVGPFTANYTMAPPLVWTNRPTSTATVNRAAGLPITWTGGTPDGYVTISGTSTYYGATAKSNVTVTFTCTARASDGTFTVPPIVLLALPPTASAPGSTIVIPGSLIVTHVGNVQGFGPPSGVEATAISSVFAFANSATFQ